MKYSLNNDSLTIKPVGSINSTNADNIEKEINKIIEKNSFSSIELDFSDVDYISSAGLRVVLKLKQRHNNFEITDVSRDVYEIFKMTSFTEIMTIKKALNKVSVDGKEIIGEGYFSKVYRLDRDTIVKVYTNGTDIKDIERELKLAKEAFILGIPTAISFDIVKVENNYGVRFELIDSLSLRDLFRDRPNDFDKLVKDYANLLLKMNNINTKDASLPDAKKNWIKKLESFKNYLEKDKYNKLLGMLQGIDDRNTFIHGDSHFKNIMMQNNELLLIDMDTLSKGHPIFELSAGLYTPYKAFEEDDKGNIERFFKVSKELVDRVYDGVMRTYFKNFNESINDKIRIVSYIHLLWWNRTFENDDDIRFNSVLSKLLYLVDKYDDLDIGI